MDFKLVRTSFDKIATTGSIYDPNGRFLCFTLELPFIDGGPGSAIVDSTQAARGKFQLSLQPSPRFQLSTDPWVKQYADAMIHLNAVPDRTSIMIHWGNIVKDTEGCILVGAKRGDDFIGSSRNAFARLYELLRGPISSGDCYLVVTRQTSGN